LLLCPLSLAGEEEEEEEEVDLSSLLILLLDLTCATGGGVNDELSARLDADALLSFIGSSFCVLVTVEY